MACPFDVGPAEPSCWPDASAANALAQQAAGYAESDMDAEEAAAIAAAADPLTEDSEAAALAEDEDEAETVAA